MTTTLCVSGAVLIKAGKNVSSALGDTEITRFINEAEGFLCSLNRENWIDNYASLNADVKYILQEACSNIAAMYCVIYDMSGYTTRIEAEDIINVLWARTRQLIKVLEDQKTVTFLKGA